MKSQKKSYNTPLLAAGSFIQKYSNPGVLFFRNCRSRLEVRTLPIQAIAEPNPKSKNKNYSEDMGEDDEKRYSLVVKSRNLMNSESGGKSYVVNTLATFPRN
jgi:hypothetical protein